jgi:16S rRNA (cytosine967-C5)-methyltransferase
MPPAPARIAAYNALRTVAAGHGDLPAALTFTRQHLSDERDRALAADIVTGTLRWQRSLDVLIEHFARRSLATIDFDVLQILRLSLYQLLHLDRVPASAVVDDAVDLARYARKASATGFVNAVLRTTLRERRRLPLPARPAPPLDRNAALSYLGVTHSHPEWLVARLTDRYGFEAAERWVRFNNDTPRLTVRANTLRTRREELAATFAREGIETEPTPHAPDGLIVISGNPLRARTDGSFLVQDEASQLVSYAVGARPDEHVLDLCASPGNKTVAMAADMRNTGLLVACDVRPRRIKLLNATVHAAWATRVRIIHLSASGELPFQRTFDRVFVDAPCSGLGTIRRDPDIRWRRNENDLHVFAADQLALLRRAAAAVRAGGRLVYATCSSEPEENDGVVDAFLSEHPDFAPIDLRADNTPVIAPLLDGRGMLRTLPFAHGLEAFFAAAMMRRS